MSFFRVRKEVGGEGVKSGRGSEGVSLGSARVYSADKTDQHACNAEPSERRRRETG